ncbi:hypothetical protein [Amycolatopsis sp. NBC_01480]|jgi:hypothetical protein|uniref:hypothetical protein n=1 Tax=Amycolatopsis sp. NBC_01480 TaxID=2903562 RepID=UPI002E2B17AA|nr:hypothetical protein [Amycolatopsis sp. NBC_01480]
MSAEKQVTEVDVDLIEIDEVTVSEREDRRKKAYIVEVRTPAGFEARFRVHPQEKLEGGTSVPLVPSATLKEAGVVAGTVCVLVVADPQVDG